MSSLQICSFGIPAASALAIDLLQQTKFPTANRGFAQRAEIIQDLCLFVGSLEWVGPQFGNYLLCQRVRKMIKGILDRVLAPPSHAVVPLLETKDPESDFGGIGLDELPMFGAELEDWFETMDWDAIAW